MFGSLDQDAAELALVAERNAQRLLDLINDILDLERIDSGRLSLHAEDVALDELLQESVGAEPCLRRALSGSGSSCKPTARGCWCTPIAGRLLQVMTNLISNAAKFSPEGGPRRAERLVRGCARPGDGRGSRPGIPQEFRSRIFGRFAQADSALTRKKGGTGLGLAICKRLIELMGGEIWYDDREGGGTSFHFRLRRTAQPGPDRTEIGMPIQPLRRICCVEDDDDIRRIMRLSLERIGKMTVDLVADPALAIDSMIAFRPDLVMLDWMMPGMDGPDPAAQDARSARNPCAAGSSSSLQKRRSASSPSFERSAPPARSPSPSRRRISPISCARSGTTCRRQLPSTERGPAR
jgi:CheY-like chemotaxis protein